MLLHEIIPQFPNFHQPHLPPALQAQSLCLTELELHLNPNPWDSHKHLKDMKEHDLKQPLDATFLLQSL